LLHAVLLLALGSEGAPSPELLDGVLGATPHLRVVQPDEQALGEAV
jgi:hypothetical protein